MSHMKKMEQDTKRIARRKGISYMHVIWMWLLIVIFMCGNGITAQAATVDFAAKVAELKVKFPHDKYWNHMGMSKDNSDGYTDSPCELHGTSGIHVAGTSGCTCNHFSDKGHVVATQCMGFANKLGHDVFGDTTWSKISSPTSSQIADIRVGDIVRLDYNSHSVFVVARTGNEILVGEANYPNGCRIKWGRKIDLSTANITYYERAANYDTVLGKQNIDVEDFEKQTESGGMTDDNGGSTTTEEKLEFTGWKKASDGIHYQYYKLDVLQKKKWITVSKKKYYVDKKGYRVTGFNDIKNYTYYFNSKGVMQKNKWFKKDGEIYHVNESGIVLKSQWLYYKGKSVYVTKDGSMAKNEIVKIGSKQYYFNSKGKRSKGFKKYNGKYYYTNSQGILQKKKWITKGGKKYYLQKNGVRAQSKILKIGKYQYYFDEKGCLVKNKKVTYKNKIYKADKKGRCKFIRDVIVEESTTQETTDTTNQEQTTETNPEATSGDMDYVTDLTQ